MPSPNDPANESLTRPLSHAVHSLINRHRSAHQLAAFEWDISLYYLSLSLAKSHLKHHLHPAAHRGPASPCIGIPYKTSAAITPAPPDADRVFRRLRSRNWTRDAFIYSVVGAYQRAGKVAVVNVVSRGAVIPRTVCPLCSGGCHFSASAAAAVFARRYATRHQDADDTTTTSAGAGSVSDGTSPTWSPSLPPSAVTPPLPGSAATASASASLPGGVPYPVSSPAAVNPPHDNVLQYPVWPGAQGWGQYVWYGYNHGYYPT